MKAGDKVAKGDALLGIEAMKMETTIFAEWAGQVQDITVKPGDQVDVGDLLVAVSGG